MITFPRNFLVLHIAADDENECRAEVWADLASAETFYNAIQGYKWKAVYETRNAQDWNLRMEHTRDVTATLPVGKRKVR